ncbi:MAG: 30S ribosome-binding factor RbfA [Bacilli bacterium]|jgi:ribosome-binding factor A
MANKNERLKAIIGKDIKDICEFELKNENIGFFTITDVVVSDDHSYAKVYVSFLNNASDGVERLNRAKGFVRSSLAKKIDTRRVPEVSFVLDTSYEKQKHFEEVLEAAKNKTKK